MVIRRDSQLNHAESDFETLSLKQDVFIRPFPSRSGIYEEEGWNEHEPEMLDDVKENCLPATA